MSKYARQIKTAQRLISKYGMVCKWTVNRPAAPEDANKPWRPTEPEEKTSFDVEITFVPVNLRHFETKGYIPKTDLKSVCYLGYMGKVPFDPNTKDTIERNGKTLNVEYIDIIEPSGEDILYTILFVA